MNNRYMDDLADSKSEVLAELVSLLSKSAEPQPSTESLFEEFQALEDAIRSDAKLLKTFRSLKARFQNDEVYRTAVDENFVAAVEMMNLEDTEETK